MSSYRSINRAVPKSDAFALMSGAPAYTGDMVARDALVVKLLRSPHASARILEIDKTKAEAVPGVVCVLTYQDVPAHRHTYAGANFPGNNPLDRLILDNIVRYVGDPVAIVAAETGAAAEKALRLIKVKYDVQEPVLDFETAETAATVVHPEGDVIYQCDVGGDLQHNILSSGTTDHGDFDAVYAACPVKMDETWYTGQNQQMMMETVRTFSYIDYVGRLTLVSSTQITFHARRLVSDALGIPISKVRVIKPRIGGGFGTKQSICSEMYPSVVTYLTGRPAYCEYTRKECCACTNTRHAFRLRVRLGAELDGTVKAIWLDSLENAGAYGEHAVNVIGLSFAKTVPLYGKAADWRFTKKVVYTNTTPGGAYRGFGATQGCFAIESTVNKMAQQLGLDPAEVRLKNLPEVGKPMSAYYDEVLTSCSLDRCIEKGKKMIGWAEKFNTVPFSRKTGATTFRGVGMAVTMQGSGISHIDRGSVVLRLEDGGTYGLSIGASDMGTGCDTILAQMAAEILQCDPGMIQVSGVDTSVSPYDKGSYASCTTYMTGNATVNAAKELIEKMKAEAALRFGTTADHVEFDGAAFYADGKKVTLYELGRDNVTGTHDVLAATASWTSEQSPPPFVASFAEVEVDVRTGKVKLCDLVNVVDCGTVINKALARVQTEGGMAQGVGMALYEQITFSENGKLSTDSMMQYKIPSRLDVPEFHVAFEESYEPSGPFGAKSIGEVVINAPPPAITAAIRNAVGVDIHSLPATAEKVFRALHKD